MAKTKLPRTHWVLHRRAAQTVCGKQASHPRRWTHTDPSCVDCRQCLRLTQRCPDNLIPAGTHRLDVMAAGAMVAHLTRTQPLFAHQALKLSRRLCVAAQVVALPIEDVTGDAILAVYRTRTPGEWLRALARGDLRGGWLAVATFAQTILAKYPGAKTGNRQVSNREVVEDFLADWEMSP